MCSLLHLAMYKGTNPVSMCVCVCVLSLGKGGLVGRVCMSECVCALCGGECIVRETGETKNLPCREREGAGEERERERRECFVMFLGHGC